MQLPLMRTKLQTVLCTVTATITAMIALSLTANAGEVKDANNPLSSTLAVLKVNDPRLLDRETTQFAAGLGIDPTPMRAGMARLLFRSRTLDGIDLSRPALMGWRAKEPKLVAIVPLSDRRLFLDNFGASFGEDSPLIRVNEREGTVVYTQNGNDGLIEYRLLVSDRAAYLAGNIAECRALAAYQLPPAITEAPLIFRANADYVKQFQISDTIFNSENEAAKGLAAFGNNTAWLGSVIAAGWNAFINQIQNIELSVSPDHQGVLHFSLSVQALPESQLAVWISNQRNQPSRLLSIVRSQDSMLNAAGNIRWQGQAEQLGHIFLPLVKAKAGDRWTPLVEENWTALWALADRAGPFAYSADIAHANGKVVGESRYISDQPKAQEVLSLITLLSQTITGKIGEVVSAGVATGYREKEGDIDSVLVANERFLMSVQSSAQDAAVAATAISEKSMTIGAPEGASGIVVFTTNLTPYVRTLVLLLGGEQQPGLPQVSIECNIKTGLPEQLVLEGTLPASQIAQLLRDSGLMQLLK